MPSNSTVTLQQIADYARTYPDIAPFLPVAGYGAPMILNIGNDVITAMIARSFPWKWNRQQVPPFYTISWQQDYASPATNVKWLENCWIIDINNTALPKPIWDLEAVRDLKRISYQYGRPGQVCWLPNDQLVYGTWGGGNTSNTGAIQPGPNVVYTPPLGASQTPSNPIAQVKDTNGNLQVLTVFGTTGSTQPAWPAAGAAPGTTTADGTCTWTVVDPKAQGFRLNPVPPQSGVVYQVNIVAQNKPPQFTSLSQFLAPVPDDYAPYFRQGFITHCYRHSPEQKIRAKFVDEYKLWMQSLADATGDADRERDSSGFYPDKSIMDQLYGVNWGPAWPYGHW